jgi:hypothetical protein
VLDRDQVRRLRNEGKSLREISDTLGLSVTTTARILKTASTAVGYSATGAGMLLNVHTRGGFSGVS